MGCCAIESDFRLEESNSIDDFITLLEERLDMVKKRKDNIKLYLKSDNNNTNTQNDSDELFKNESKMSLMEHIAYLKNVMLQLFKVRQLLISHQEALNWYEAKSYLRNILMYSNRFSGNEVNLFSSVKEFEHWVDMQ